MRMRKKKNGSRRIENLSALFVKKNDDGTFSSPEFTENKPLRIEIGCGKGDFICGISELEGD